MGALIMLIIVGERFSHKTSGQQTNISYEKTELKLSNYKKQNRGQFRTKETKIVQEKEEKQKEKKPE